MEKSNELTPEEKFVQKLRPYLIPGIPLLVIFKFYTEYNLDPALLPKFIGLAVFALGLVLFFIFKIGKDAGVFKPGLPLGLGICLVGYLAIGGLSLFRTIDVPDGIFDWLKMMLNASILFLFAGYYRKSGEMILYFSRSVSFFNLLAGIFGIIALVQVLLEGELSHQATYGISLTFAHRNLFAEVLLLCLPFAVYSALYDKKLWRGYGIAGVLLSLFMIIILLTRAVWLGTLVFGLVSAVMAIMGFARKERNIAGISLTLKNGLKYSLLLIPVFVLAWFIYKKAGTVDTFRKQSVSMFNGGYGSAKDRMELWKKSGNILLENQIFGTGIGSWKIEVLKYPVTGSTAEDGYTFYQSPHNDFLWVGSEMGLPGLLFYIGIFFTVLYYIVNLLRKSLPPEVKGFLVLSAGGICAYMVCACFSFPRERMEESTLLTFLIAPVLVAFREYKNSDANSLKEINKAVAKPYALYLIGLVPLVALFFGFPRAVSDHTLKDAFEARNQGNWGGVVNLCEKTKAVFYPMDPMSTPVSWYSGSAWFNMNKGDESMRDFQLAYDKNPWHVHVLNNLGTCFELKQDHKRALELYTEALRINPAFAESGFNKAAVFHGMGQTDSAIAVFLKIPQDTMNPRYREFNDVLVMPVLKSIYEKIDAKDEWVKYLCGKMIRTSSWYFAVVDKCNARNHSLEYQTFDDIFFILEHENKEFSADSLSKLKTKYLP